MTRAALATAIGDIYRDAAYLDIDLTSLDHATPAVTAASIDVDLNGTLSEGEPYRLSALNWAGSEVISAADFAKASKLHPEDVASQTALRQSLRSIAAAFYAKGYQDARVQAPATLDHATHHVTYTVHVIPGEQYRLHSLTVLGLTDQQRREFDAAWSMHPGDFYDVTYVTGFLSRNTAARSLLGFSASYRAVSPPDTHIADLTLTFVKGGTLIVQPQT